VNATETRPAMTAVARAAQPEPAADDFQRLLTQRAFTPQDLMHGDNLDRIERIAVRMSEGRMTVPEYLRGNVGDCMAIAMQAMLWGMDPFVVAQKTHIVSGKLGYEAQLVIAVVMASGAIRGSFHFEYRGEGSGLECRVGAVLRGQADVTWGEWIASSAITTKNSSLWKTNPKQQLGYLQAKNWARIYCPGAILGVYTVDELQDIEPAPFRAAAPASAPASGRPELPAYAPDAFEKNFPAWASAVSSGKKTAPDLLAMLSTKAVFSEEQKARILSLRAAPPPAADPPQEDATDAFVAAMDRAAGGEE
jgi:hypothetical protein